MRQKVLKVLNVFDQSDDFFRKVLNAAGKIVAPGVTTEEIDALVGFHLISCFSCSCIQGQRNGFQ